MSPDSHEGLKMTLTDLLLQKEREALAAPATLPAQEILPYLKHKSFIDLVIAQGNLYRAQEIPPMPFFGRLEGDEKLVQHHRRMSQIKYAESIAAIRQSWHDAIDFHQFFAYQVGLAGRALDYARQHMPGIRMEAPNLEQVARENQNVTSSEAMHIIEEAVKNPLIRVSEALHKINSFYERSIGVG